MERVIDPIVADLQCEYSAASVRGSRWRARAVLVRSYVGLGTALICLGVRHVCDPRSDNPGADVARMWIVSLAALGVITVGLILPPLVTWPRWRQDFGFAALLSVTLIPQALPLSIPAGVCIGVLWTTRGKPVTWRRLCAVLAVAMVATAIVWVVMEWLLPLGNQQFREMIAARLADGHIPRLEPGRNELGLSRLAQRTDPAAVRQYHMLWALCFAAIPLSLLACALAGYLRRAASSVVLAIGLSISYMECVWVLAATASRMPGPAVIEAWTPNILALLVAVALLGRRLRVKTADNL